MKKLIGLFFLLCLFVSCEYNVEIKFDQITFNDQRQQWRESNVKNYKYQLFAFGFIPYDGIIIVENGFHKENFPVEDYMNIDNFLEYSTINEIYNTIENIFISNNNKKYSKSDVCYEEIYIEYDKANHIPIKINYKYYAPSNVSVDGTFYYEIKSFEKMN